MTANKEKIEFFLDQDGRKSVFELNILQEFGPKQLKREPHNVNLCVHPSQPGPTQQLFFILKALSGRTYTCLESLNEMPDGKMALVYLQKLYEGKVDYNNDLVKQKKLKCLAAQHDSLPLVFGSTPKSSTGYLNDFRERIYDIK